MKLVAKREMTAKTALMIVVVLYFIFGFLTCLNDILVPHLKSVFELSYAKAMLIQFCFFSAYFVGSIPFGNLVHRVGYKRGMMSGLSGAGIGALLLYQAAEAQSFPLFLGAFFILALGITLLQVAANPYVLALGPLETSSIRLSLVQGFNSLGTTVAPLVGSALIFSRAVDPHADLSPADLRAAQASVVQGPYFMIAIALFCLAAWVFFSKLPQLKASSPSFTPLTAGEIHLAEAPQTLWQHRHLLLGTIAIFSYVGAEVSIGSFLVSFLSQVSESEITHATAGNYVSFYWGGAMIGRFLGSWLMTRVRPTHLLAFNASMALVLVSLAIGSSGNTAMIALLSVGLCNSIMFPTIFSLALKGLGNLTALASGLLCTAIVGGAVTPLVQGFLADQISLQYSFAVPLVCYVYVLFYGLKGSQMRVQTP